MEARKVQIKLFLDGASDSLDPDPFVPVFHRWIRENTLNEVLVDVTDYAHVLHAPAVLLVGHGSDYAIDFAEGRPGLLYSRKREAPSGAVECVLDALRRTLLAAAKLEQETSLPFPVRFRTDEILFRLNDRLLAPNTEDTAAQVTPVVREAFGKAFDGALSFERTGSPRELLALRVKTGAKARASDLLARLA
jgi:hypothetical protein